MNEPPAATRATAEAAAFETRLGYRFSNAALLLRALTHRSYDAASNERLEYLGDSVLGMCISAALFERFPDADQGDLTRMRANLVCNPVLAEQARALLMQDCMRFGGSVTKSGNDEHDALLADAFEAVFGAVYLDGGFDAAHVLTRKLFASHLARVSSCNLKDHKTRLQERLQKQGLPLPQYKLLARSGKEHAAVFTVSCDAGGLKTPVVADGGSRRAAEQRAAEKALLLLDHV